MAYSTPPRPANAAPTAKVNEMTPSTLMPIKRAVGLSNEVARMALPILVRRTRNCSNTCTTIERDHDDQEDVGEDDALFGGGAWPGCSLMDAVADVPGHDLERPLVGNEAGREDEIECPEEFQEERYADGGDQGGDARRIAQRLVGHALDDDRQSHADHHREQHHGDGADDHRQPRRACLGRPLRGHR